MVVSYNVLGITDNDKQFKLIIGFEYSNQALYIEQEVDK